MVALVGPNGSGKTTLMRIMSGVLQADSGEILVAGDNKTLYFMQDNSILYTYLTGMNHLLFVGRMYGNVKKITEVVEKLHLMAFINKKVETYSLGMKQQLLFAMVLVSDGDILILDEPFNGLDPSVSGDFKCFIQELKRSGKQIFVSSHILSDIDEIADTVLFLKQGMIIRAEEVGEQHLEDYQIILKTRLTEQMMKTLESHNSIYSFSIRDENILLVKISSGKLIDLTRILNDLQVDVADILLQNEKTKDLYHEIYEQKGTDSE
ncbi:ABC transporter-like protein [Listeria fleischmannii 1991]|uniref:ABC transporter-like protein n=1 Tax=Listeria fleischmannii 1991 TaxID=1430899 RepID=A0A0J8GEP6_9LIST|nr:ABC transporter-like protein [Listeria fleischmannii subsp. fleischmannii LU2006-1]KMT59258.1 ABC transporter-like protein [Listeria fleischmannii 1991]